MINPIMLSLARELRGLTQSEVCERLGCAQGTLSKAENGQLELSGQTVNDLAHLLRVPPEFFYQPLRYRNLPLTFFRKRIRVSQTIVKAITAKSNILRLHIERLARSAELPACRVPSIDLEEFDNDPRRVARELRIALHVPPGPIANMIRVLEDAGVLVISCDFGTNQIDGLSIYEPSDGLPPIILISPTVPGDRLRYTLAHELMHIVLHHHRSIPGPDVEDEANVGASEFLMPAADIRGFLSNLTINRLADLKSYWRVSMQALIMRAADLNKITERQKRSLFMRMGQLGYRTQEPVPVPKEEPTLITELITFHLEDLGYTEEELARVLLCELSEFRELYRGGARSPNLRMVRPGVVRAFPGSR